MRLLVLFWAVLVLAPMPASASSRDDARKALLTAVTKIYASDYRTARVDLLNARKADPAWGLPYSVAARNDLALGDATSAEAALTRAINTGIPANTLQHLQFHVWLFQGKPELVLSEPLSDQLSVTARSYALRMRARAAIAVGNFRGAGEEFDAALALTPQSSLLWSDMGRSRMQGGDLAGGIAATERATRLNPRNLEALMLMGELMRGQYGLMASIPWFERVLAIDKVNVPAMLQIAATLGDAGHAQDMLTMSRRVLFADPGNAQAWYLQAVLAARASKPQLARGLLYRISGRLDDLPGMMLLKAVLGMQEGNSEEAIANLQDLVKAQPDNLRARRLLGTAMWRAGDAQSAISVLGKMATRPDADSYTLSVIGRAYEASGDRQTAARYLERASSPVKGQPVPFEMEGDLARLAQMRSGNPDDANVAVPRIASIIANGDAGQGLLQSQQLLARNPGAPEAHILVGDAFMALDRPKDASQAYANAANIRFSEPVALRFIMALRASGQEAGALRVLDIFLAQNPRSVAGLLLASDHFMATGQWDAAIKVMEGLRTRLGNGDATILNNLGWAWFSKGDAAKAQQFASAAYALAPANPAVVNSYGWILYKSGRDKSGGIALLQKAVQIAPAHPGLQWQLAQALTGVGRKADARPHLLSAMAAPDFPDRKSVVAMLAANGG